MNDLIIKGIRLSWLLRHDSKSFNKGLIDENGWRCVDELVRCYGFTPELLQDIVAQNNKQRFEYNDDETKIRARQGHSIPDSPFLWHGTSIRFIENIKAQGLIPKSRLYVHLSGDKETALKVGRRHGGITYIICIDALQMVLDGKKIYISNNGVYNIDKVETKYLISFEKYE